MVDLSMFFLVNVYQRLTPAVHLPWIHQIHSLGGSTHAFPEGAAGATGTAVIVFSIATSKKI